MARIELCSAQTQMSLSAKSILFKMELLEFTSPELHPALLPFQLATTGMARNVTAQAALLSGQGHCSKGVQKWRRNRMKSPLKRKSLLKRRSQPKRKNQNYQ